EFVTPSRIPSLRTPFSHSEHGFVQQRAIRASSWKRASHRPRASWRSCRLRGRRSPRWGQPWPSDIPIECLPRPMGGSSPSPAWSSCSGVPFNDGKLA
ncbi:unnamed protein product, partial [Musa acuminata subsp. burmannicoides]